MALLLAFKTALKVDVLDAWQEVEVRSGQERALTDVYVYMQKQMR
jgi:hypothetical protein